MLLNQMGVLPIYKRAYRAAHKGSQSNTAHLESHSRESEGLSVIEWPTQ